MVPRNRKPGAQKTFGARCKELRIAMGIPSQAEVSRLTGIGQVSVSNIEIELTKAEKVRAATLFALADLFKVRARWLLYGTGARDYGYSAATPEESRLLSAFRDVPRSMRLTALAELEAAAIVHAVAVPIQEKAASAKRARPKNLNS